MGHNPRRGPGPSRTLIDMEGRRPHFDGFTVLSSMVVRRPTTFFFRLWHGGATASARLMLHQSF